MYASTQVVKKYRLVNVNLRRPRGVCSREVATKDGSGRRGWLRIDCSITVRGRHGRGCFTKNSPPANQVCTGTVWQERHGVFFNLGAPVLNFRVLLVPHPTRCTVVARSWQRPPFEPRLLVGR